MIDVCRVTTPQGDEVLTARVVVEATATGADIERHIENLDDAIWAACADHDVTIIGRMLSGRFYYSTADEAFDTTTKALSHDLQFSNALSLRVWRFVEEGL